MAHINISEMGVHLTAGACDHLIGSIFSSFSRTRNDGDDQTGGLLQFLDVASGS